ncbi:organic solvent tolerance protein [Candidatus Pelagibacter sp.]|nr:organic solvent tolerance protein [Candidatus Pelagibacter sp.]
MKNSFKYFILVLFFYSYLIEIIRANEPFIFDVTEIEILKNGNQINGYNGGTATSEDGSQITAEKFYYNKLTNILEAIGDVKYVDKIKNIVITADSAIYLKNKERIFSKGNSRAISEKNTITASNLEYDKIQNIFKAETNAEIKDFEKDTTINADKITYLKNDEKIFTEGKTEAFIEKKYIFNSKNVSYYRNLNNLSSEKKSSVEDDNGNIYNLDNFSYNAENKILKGEKVFVLAKVDKDKTDKYYFSEGFFDFKNQSHIAKETKIKTHKSVFGDENHDPRLYGSSSYSDEFKTIVNNGIFTSCKINDNCPPWSITAEKITHDKKKQDMIYKNAILKIYDFPVLYYPKFFHPDPSVKRRSGFLKPQFNNSETLGSSLYIPYFKTLGDDMDLTFKPTFFEKLKSFKKEKYLLQTEVRKKYKNSSVIADFGFLRDYKPRNENNYKNVNHLFVNFTGDFGLSNHILSRYESKIERVNNSTYLKVFQNVFPEDSVMTSDQSTLNSNLKFYFDKESQNFDTGIEIYESLGTTKSSDKYQYTLPYYNFTKNLDSDSNFLDNFIGGSLSFSSSGTNTLTNTNNLKTLISNNINYTSMDFISSLGFKNNFYLYFQNLNSIAKNDDVYSSSAQIDGMSIFKIDSVFPLSKSKEMSSETLTPKISFRVNPGNNMSNFSDLSSNITANNVFDINRLGLSNDFEAGKSLTFGLDYKLDPTENFQSKETKDKFLELKLATVIRDQYETGIPTRSTINRKNSNIFGTINNNLLENINFSYDFSLDNDMKTINENTIGTEISINNFVTSFTLYEQRNELGETHVLSNSTEYKVNDNSSLKFSTRRNKEINLTEYYDLSYEYKNDCLTAALRFNKTFYQDKDLVPTEDLFFSVTIIPLTTYEREIYKKTPGQMGLKGWFR